MRRAGTSTNISSTAAGVACRASARRSSRTTPSWSAPSNVYWRKPNEIADRRAVPCVCNYWSACAGQEGCEEGTERQAEGAAGAHEGLQRQGRRQERRRAPEVHELVPEQRQGRTDARAEGSAGA